VGRAASTRRGGHGVVLSYPFDTGLAAFLARVPPTRPLCPLSDWGRTASDFMQGAWSAAASTSCTAKPCLHGLLPPIGALRPLLLRALPSSPSLRREILTPPWLRESRRATPLLLLCCCRRCATAACGCGQRFRRR